MLRGGRLVSFQSRFFRFFESNRQREYESSRKEYAKKRDFKKTAEPSGGRLSKSSGRRFVVQKHDASRLHYDLRLEFAGKLKSWAVPKGFPYLKGEKHLPVQGG